MRVIVYVEGPSDKLAMEVLLQPLLERKLQKGIRIDFFESPPGDKKAVLLTKVPVKAADILIHDTEAMVAIVPDLYPQNKGFDHCTVQ